MSTEVASVLLQISAAILAAHVAVATLLPHVIKKLSEAGEQYTGTGSSEARFLERYHKPVRIFTFLAQGFWISYILSGASALTLAIHIGFSDIPCTSFTCHILWAPYIAAVLVASALTTLLAITCVALYVLSLASRDLMHDLLDEKRGNQ